MVINDWLFKTNNNSSYTDRCNEINSEREFKLKILYLCIVSKAENGEASLSYTDLSSLVYKYSAKMFDLKKTTLVRMTKELEELNLIAIENDFIGKTPKNTYKIL